MLYIRRFYCRMIYLIPFIICIIIAFIIIFLIYGQPKFAFYFLSKYYSDVLFYIDLPSNLRYISLTIDDFPNPNDLSISFEILDLLRLHDAKCTFFVIGEHVKKYANSPEIRTLFNRLIDEGHEIGNHGWRDEQALRLSENELIQQITDTEKMISNYTDSFRKKWFRPGSGFFNQTMITICKRFGYRLVLGSIYPYDPQIPNPKLNSNFIKLKLYPGAIVILHDRAITLQTLKLVLPAIEQKSFQIVTLTELMNLKQ